MPSGVALQSARYADDLVGLAPPITLSPAPVLRTCVRKRPITNAGAEHRRTGSPGAPLRVHNSCAESMSHYSPTKPAIDTVARWAPVILWGTHGSRRPGRMRPGRRAERRRLYLSLRRTRLRRIGWGGSSWPSSSTRRCRATSCAWSGTLGALVAMNVEVATPRRQAPARPDDQRSGQHTIARRRGPARVCQPDQR
jgi:hypothetical protein